MAWPTHPLPRRPFVLQLISPSFYSLSIQHPPLFKMLMSYTTAFQMQVSSVLPVLVKCKISLYVCQGERKGGRG